MRATIAKVISLVDSSLATSSLDVSVGSNRVQLLRDIRREPRHPRSGHNADDLGHNAHTFTLTVTDEAPEISPVAGSYVVDDARPQYFVIYLKPNATRSQREIAYSFNLKCLDKIGGCRDKYELLMGSAIPNQQAADGSGKGCDENCTRMD